MWSSLSCRHLWFNAHHAYTTFFKGQFFADAGSTQDPIWIWCDESKLLLKSWKRHASVRLRLLQGVTTWPKFVAGTPPQSKRRTTWLFESHKTEKVDLGPMAKRRDLQDTKMQRKHWLICRSTYDKNAKFLLSQKLKGNACRKWLSTNWVDVVLLDFGLASTRKEIQYVVWEVVR